MLSSSRETSGPSVSFKTPGPKRRAFGDISNRKPSAVHSATGKKSTAVAVVKPVPTTTTKSKTEKKVVNTNKSISFDIDNEEEEDDMLEFPAGRRGKDFPKEAWLYLDDVFAELANDRQKEREEIAAAQEHHQQELMERQQQRRMELERDQQEILAADVSFLRKDFEKYCLTNFDDDDDDDVNNVSFANSHQCDELYFPFIEI